MKHLTKNDLEYGDVLMFTPHKGDVIAQAIAFLTNGNVHHAALCYYEDGGKDDKCVMESLIGQGLVINYLQDKEERTFPVYVARFNKELPLAPVLDIAQRYYEQKNHYPIPNIVLLSILLLTRKFPLKNLKQQIVYDFLCGVASLLMDYIRTHGNESSMICSQFVAQCFSDVEDSRYDLTFDKLVIFDISNIDVGTNASLLELIKEDENDYTGSKLQDIHMDKEVFAKTFKEFTETIFSTGKQSQGLKERDCESMLSFVASEIKKMLDTFFTKHFGIDFSMRNYTKLRNYLITPQDLYANTPSLTIIGTLEYADA